MMASAALESPGRDIRRLAGRRVLAVLLALVALLWSPAAPTATPVGECASGKTACARSYMTALLHCHDVAERSGAPLDAACIQKALDRFTGGATPGEGCFAQLEARMACGAGDAAQVQARTDFFVLDVVTGLDPGYPAPTRDQCSAGKKRCAARFAAALFRCYGRAERTGSLDPACVRKAEDRFAGRGSPSSGCFGRLEAERACLTSGDTQRIRRKVEAYVDDVVCILDPAAGTCPPPPCDSTAYPTCGGGCESDLDLVCAPLSGRLHTVCTCVPRSVACPPGQALMLTIDGQSAIGCAPIPTCWQSPTGYPICDGAPPPGMACGGVVVHSLFLVGCFPVGETPCTDTCSPLGFNMGTCPPGEACYADPLGPCGCFPATTECCQGYVPSDDVSVCADLPSATAASQCDALSSTLAPVGGSATLGPGGTVCDGSGVCVGFRGTVADCCQGASLCVEGTGPAFDAGCGSLGGVLNAGQLCTPSGTCVP